MTRGVHALLHDTTLFETEGGQEFLSNVTGPQLPVPNEPSLQLITLHLARCADFPEGSRRRGYIFVVPLTADGRLDAGTWHEQRKRCFVRRFWDGEPDRVGHLVHQRGGAGGARWCFAYDDVLGNKVEPGHHLEGHRLAPGEYISILQDGDELMTFEVADVRKVCLR